MQLKLDTTGLGGSRKINGSVTAFDIYSSDGATWSMLVLDTMAGQIGFPSQTSFHYFNNDGAGHDTAYVGMLVLNASNEPLWNAPDTVIPFLIRLTLDNASIGKTICIDSVKCAIGCDNWTMTTTDLAVTVPTWGGPYCFTIADCCQGTRGNFDGDLSKGPSIVDILKMISFFFLGGPPPACMSEVDYNGNGTFNIADVNGFISWLLLGGTQSVCP